MDSPGLVVLSTLLTRHLSFHLYFHLSFQPAFSSLSLSAFCPSFSLGRKNQANQAMIYLSIYLQRSVSAVVYIVLMFPFLHQHVCMCVFSLVRLRKLLSVVNGTSTKVNTEWHQKHTHTHTLALFSRFHSGELCCSSQLHFLEWHEDYQGWLSFSVLEWDIEHRFLLMVKPVPCLGLLDAITVCVCLSVCAITWTIN